MHEVTILMAGTDHEASSVLAVYQNENDADNAIELISEWHKNKPNVPGDSAPQEDWDSYDKYNNSFPFGSHYYADRYYKVNEVIR